jgi:NTE family protein
MDNTKNPIKTIIAKYMEIVYGGGGTLAPLHVGATNAIYDHGYEASFIVGTSAGAIIGALLALGVIPSEMKNIVLSADFAKLIPYNYLLEPFRGYLASNKNVISWLKELTNNKTMADCKIPLITIASDLTTAGTAIFDSREVFNSNLFVWEAIIPSMSIPDIFPLYKEKYEDGGLMNNLGVNYLPRKHRTVGLRITEATTIGPVAGFVDKNIRSLGMMLSASERDMVMLAKTLKIPIINLKAGNTSFLDRGMSQSKKLSLYNVGYDTMSKYLESNP